ncbi:MAG TPA: peptidylprolyl isomerase [Candidatus Latescibacteria bacterium]|nr:peptidylprolyl isomerase [Candidatus Handelsmanbacteria bacterium]HIL09689.1 peptidylprolyl isomerase [Candidatus Latescibacterota bacterium]
MPTAQARHILVPSEDTANEVKTQIEGGTDFADAAKEHSTCPSGKSGGDLGTFGKGQMVPEFDAVIFSDELNVVHGPVQTQFGYHLIEITSRTD